MSFYEKESRDAAAELSGRARRRNSPAKMARAVSPYAAGVKIVNLPGLSEHQDVSDYLQSYSIQDLFAEIAKTPQWFPPKLEQKLFVPVTQFVATIPDQIDWLIDGVLQRRSNGMITAAPKTGKSWAAVDMAIALALGESWLGFNIPRPAKVALVSREDNPALTSWRLKNLWRGRAASNPALIESNLYVNTRMQSPQLLLDDEAQLTELLDAMRAFNPEFAIFDVFNVLHAADENDNTQMSNILRRLSRIQAEIGCGIGVVHHYNKTDLGSMTQRLRGASAIAGWCEWVIGISMADQSTKTRRAQFELKAAEPPEPVLYRMVSNSDTTTLTADSVSAMSLRKPPRADDVPLLSGRKLAGG
jgi:RecA-family ATPase